MSITTRKLLIGHYRRRCQFQAQRMFTHHNLLLLRMPTPRRNLLLLRMPTPRRNLLLLRMPTPRRNLLLLRMPIPLHNLLLRRMPIPLHSLLLRLMPIPHNIHCHIRVIQTRNHRLPVFQTHNIHLTALLTFRQARVTSNLLGSKCMDKHIPLIPTIPTITEA